MALETFPDFISNDSECDACNVTKISHIPSLILSHFFSLSRFLATRPSYPNLPDFTNHIIHISLLQQTPINSLFSHTRSLFLPS